MRLKNRPIRVALSRNRAQIALVLVVFVLFLLKAAGAFNLALDLGAGASTLRALVGQPEFLVLVATGIVLSVALPVLSPIAASALTLASMVPVFLLALRIPAERPLVPLEYSLLTILMIFVINVLVSYFTETKRKQKLVSAFANYLPAQVAREISRDPDSFSMAGEKRELSLLFCDVFDFTSFAERIDPTELVDLLQALFTPLSRIIHAHRGVIDKYMGDAIMAFWGAPVHDPHHAANAIAAAFEMQEEMIAIRSRFHARGWPAVKLGIGINTGTVAVGNMGSRYRIAYTAIGDAVNLAARLQSLTRVFDAPVIVGEPTRRAFPGAPYRELGLVRVKGKNELTRIYEPCNVNTNPESTIVGNMRRHNEALARYYARDWAAAAAMFGTLRQAERPDPLYDYYLRRIAEYVDEPPPADWRGEIRFSVK